MKNLFTALSHATVPLDHAIAVTNRNSIDRTVPRHNRALRVHSGPQVSLLAALGTINTLLSLGYVLANRPPLVLLVVAPLWSLWLLSFIDWLRGDLPALKPAVIHDSARRPEPVRDSEASAVISRCWERRLVRSRAAPAFDHGQGSETSRPR